MGKINDNTKTIAAIATSMGYGGIAIIRISGSNALSILERIYVGEKNVLNWQSHTIHYGHIIDKNGNVIDEVLVSFMKAPKSYTMENVIEINCHGGLNCVQAVLEEILNNGGVLAEAGEFTKRAFLNGRIDLTQAEAIIDIINSKTNLAAKVAVKNAKGSLTQKTKKIAEQILLMLAHIEASIDYPEHDMEEMNIAEIKDKTQLILQEIHHLINSQNKGKIIKEGIETVIVGRPNVGKSSLLNFLAGEERAIVTNIPGTTRDILHEYININDIPLKIIDTAGIRKTDDIIEKMGVEKTKEHIQNADLIMFLIDASEEINVDDMEILNLLKEKKFIILVNKVDLCNKIDLTQLYYKIDKESVIHISAKEGTGFPLLYEKIKKMFYQGEIDINNEIYISNLRQIESLKKAIVSLENALNTIQLCLSEDFVAIDLKEAYIFLGEISGETLDEGIIDKIFSEFCLGK